MAFIGALLPWLIVFMIMSVVKKVGKQAQSGPAGGARHTAARVRQEPQAPAPADAPGDPFRERAEAFESRIPEFHSLEFHDQIGEEDPCYETLHLAQEAQPVRTGSLPSLLGNAHDLVRGVMWSEILKRKE